MAFQELDKNKYVKDTLLELSELPVSDIMKQLDMLEKYSKETGLLIYPLSKTVDEKNGVKKLELCKKDPKDCVEVAYIIIAKIFSFFSNEAYNFFNGSEDPLDIASWLLYLDKNATEEEKEEVLERFDSKFSFLENIPSYKSIYTEFRKDYFKMLSKKIKNIYSVRELSKTIRSNVQHDWSRNGKRNPNQKVLRRWYD